MNNPKWWQDNDRYIPDPWAEISLLQQELKQMSITEAALRESLTGLSRESNEYRYKIETENAALRATIEQSDSELRRVGAVSVKGVVDALLREMRLNNEKDRPTGFDSWDAYHQHIIQTRNENAALRNVLQEIATTAHCIALAGPLNTPTLQDAWGKFMKIDSMASNALAKKS